MGVAALRLGTNLRGGMRLGAQARLIHSGKVTRDIATTTAALKKRDPVPHLSGTKLDPSESFLNGSNAFVIEEMYEKYMDNPEKVHPSWAGFFQNVENGLPPGQAVGLSRQSRNQVSMVPHVMTEGKDLFQVAEDTVKLMSMIRAYRHRGHFIADLDPLRIDDEAGESNTYQPPHNTKNELLPSHYGFTEADLDREFVVGAELPGPPVRTLRDIMSTLRKAYCGKVGIEYRHMLSKAEKDWIASQVESKFDTDFTREFTREQKLSIMSDLIDSEYFEKFLSMKYSTAKRFGLEGGESIIPGLKTMMLHGSEIGVQNVVIGMAHRGRLNVLANIVGKDLVQILYEFKPHPDPDLENYLGSGDVKYHLGVSNSLKLSNGHTVNFSLLANPSHLEAVDPVVVGKTRAKQFFNDDKERRRTLGLLIHGDASFAGQGVVAETLELSDLRDYTTGGTVHVIVNNQIGFTTDPRAARSSPYPTDVAKTVGVPIFHVNGDDVEAVVRVCRMAVEYRQRFRKDVVVDVFCYRRHGHNELDQATFTQPLMYRKIKSHPTPVEVYRQRLVEEGTATRQELKQMEEDEWNHLQKAFKDSADHVPTGGDYLDKQWEMFKSDKELSIPQTTGVSEKVLHSIGNAYTKIPPWFKIHPLLKKILSERREQIELGTGIDWANAEALAFGTILKQEEITVRLSGQDCERGTFSQRHMVWHDQDSGAVYTSLNNLGGKQARLQIANSNLSEMAVLGFEQGFSLEHPNALVMWEAQFGDFANGAQVILDTFIAAGERKWRRQSGIVLLLPHGYEGQGPEHSSARMERYLQMVDGDADEFPTELDASRMIQQANLQICNASTPANYFHVLRRQVCREFRKPLILFTPKSLLRHPQCRSSIKDFGAGTSFQTVIDDPDPGVVKGKNVKRLAFCSGKLYYDLVRERTVRNQNDIRFIRVEQLAPFPFFEIRDVIAQYPKAEVRWVQEESKNMGSWSYVRPHFETTLNHLKDKRKFAYIGRLPSAAPATGNANQHQQEVRNLMEDTFSY